MNKVRVRQLADMLLRGDLATRGKNPIGYNQGTFGSGASRFRDMTGHHCGTNACIAGWAKAVWAPRSRNAYESARRVLGLTGEQASELFSGVVPLSTEPTAAQAALVLYNLAVTGKVNWRVAASE